MELSDIATPEELNALDAADAKARQAWDSLTLADVLNLAQETKATLAAVKVAEQNLEAARAEQEGLRQKFTPRLVALARKNLGVPPQ